jgi:hypothetical protein
VLLRNQGGGSFARVALPPANGRMRLLSMVPNAPPDLLVDAAVVPRLHRWVGSAWVDVTSAVFPAGLTGQLFAIGDVDEDGDIDLVGNDLLRNQGGTFAVEPMGLGSATSLADLDGDRDLDLVVDGAVHRNRERHVFLPVPAATGRSLRIDVSGRPGRATAADGALLEIGLQRLVPPLRLPLGTLHLASVAAAFPLTLGVGTGLREFDLPIPGAPWLVGIELHCQALLFGPATLGFGNLASTRIE